MAEEKKERYIRMSHWVFEALYTLPMSRDEIRVMMLIIKYTVGFHRYECEMSARFAAQQTGMSYQHANRCINTLKAKGYISIIAPGSGHYPAKISFNYKKFSVAFRAEQRRILNMLASDSDTFSVTSMRQRKNINNKEQIKNKERFASEPSSLFSQDSPGSGEEEPDEEWWELHKDDDE